MIASDCTYRYSFRLILISALLCAPSTQAQQQADAAPAPAKPGESQSPAADRRIERLGEVSADEWEMDLAVPSSKPAAAGQNAELALPDEGQDQELKRLLATLADNPGDTNVLAQLDALLTEVLGQANAHLNAGSPQQAEQLVRVIQSIDPGLQGLGDVQARLQSMAEVNSLLTAGDDALESGRILEPENENALFYFNQALKKDPASEQGKLGLLEVQKALIARAFQSVRENDYEIAGAWLSEASLVRGDQQMVNDARLEVEASWEGRAVALEQQAINAMDAGNFKLANRKIIDLIGLGGQQERIDVLRVRLEEARVYGGFEPGHVIREELSIAAATAPAIIIIPAGSFRMGSRKYSEKEEPRHRVTITKGFGLGVREVTVEEFGLFIEQTGYRTTAEKGGTSSVYIESAGRINRRSGINWRHNYIGRKANPDMPVLHVSAHDADLYVQWLASETGKGYRLPSEAEYEYVARAGGEGTYWWGEGAPPAAVENLTGQRDKSPGKREWTTYFENYGDGHWGPAPAGSLGDDNVVHPMGVHDIAGNVSEWTQDCWHQNYVKAPTDGSAWFNPGCSQRVVRGGYWASAPAHSRAAFRNAVKATSFGPAIGFRVARDL
jgi:formylglycine-generating enzyme required for sulfatase activity